MKKYIPILIITSLLLNACAIGWDNSTFELQEKCAEHSKNLFNEKGYTKENSRFSSNFNKNIKKCFALIETTNAANGTIVQEKELFDAVQRTQYWYFIDSFSNWEQGYTECTVKNIQTNIQTNCAWKESFTELAKPYLEN